ncbi:hypothetical protein [Nostoc sp. NMS4]|uniref:hypothetical protein n=1 Tax=Nostoc sp. NMS4 TaxID=2815390 RepID=UPI0025EC2759|nr:hypothetical protein [Nostoc sp. NMS4]MBN3924306.1 hypothetical protein [Nostoc sp. NMS4]
MCFEVGGAKMVTHIGDAVRGASRREGGLRLRESDLFEEFATIPNKNNHLLIRACNLLGCWKIIIPFLIKN